MPGKVPVLSGVDVVRALGRLGFERVSQKGSHIKLRRRTQEGTRNVIIPTHDEVARGTLGSILAQAGITLEELVAVI